MKKFLFTVLITCIVYSLFGQNSFQSGNFDADCDSDFWTITADGYIQQWSLSGGIISGGDTILSGGGLSISYCGDSTAPTFFTDTWGQEEIGINYYEPGSGWVNIPTSHRVQDNGGHFNNQYYTVVGGVIQYVNYWDGTNLTVIDSLNGEFFAGIFDIAVNTSGHAWICTSSWPGTVVDSLKVYDQGGKINSYSFQNNIHGHGSFFLNDTLYLGTVQDSIFPVLINGDSAQLGIGIPFPANNFMDMASCQEMETTNAVFDNPSRSIKLFPNPTRGYVTLPDNISKLDIVAYNSMGQLIELKLDGNVLNLMEQPLGVYFIKIFTEQGQFHSTILKY